MSLSSLHIQKKTFAAAIMICFIFCNYSLATYPPSTTPKIEDKRSYADNDRLLQSQTSEDTSKRSLKTSSNPFDIPQKTRTMQCPFITRKTSYFSPENNILNSKASTFSEICQPNNQTIVGSALLFKEFIDSFKDNYTEKYFGDSWNITDSYYFPNSGDDYLSIKICDLNQECFVVLPQLPSSHLPPATQEELKILLVQLLGYSQRYAAAFETLFLDQTLREEIFKKQMFDSIRHTEELTATLLEAVISCALVPDEEVILNILGKTYIK
ncbi:hypothetical protein SK128_019071, partial [Halocaridina rubra]